MNKGNQYIGLWLILLISLALFIVLSAYEPIKICGVEIRTTKVYERLTREPEPTPEEIAEKDKQEAKALENELQLS